MRRGFLVPSRWRLPERQRMILPVEVILKRLAAPRCVLAFNFLFFFTISSCAEFLYALPSAFFCAGCAAGVEPAPFFGASNASRVRFHARTELYLHVIHNFLQQTVHLLAADVLVRHFAAAMENHGLYLVTFTEEADDLILANLKIMLGRGRPELNFLDVRTLLMFLGFVRFLARLVLKFAVVHQFANRRHSIGRDFHHVQAGIARGLHGVKQRHHAELISSFVHHAHFTSANSFVDPQARRPTTFCDKPTSRALESVNPAR